MSSLKEKIFNKKIFLIVGIVVIIIVLIKLLSSVFEKNKDTETISKSGLGNISAISTTSSIKGNTEGVEEFLKLAESQKIEFESENLENCLNITPDHILQNSEYKIFKFKDTAETFIIYQDMVYKIGNNKRERGTTSFALADINGDDNLELFYTYVWNVSKVIRTNVSYFEPVEKKEFGINKNYTEETAILVKSKEELSVFGATLSRDVDPTDFSLNAKLEKDVLVNNDGVIEPLSRIEFEEIFAIEKNK